MSAPKLFLSGGAPLKLGQRIGRGGEGEVFEIVGDAAHAVKRYTIKDLASRRAKTAAMVGAGLALQSELVAFPTAVVHDQAGAFAGFIMRRVVAHRPLHELYAPGARKTAFPAADYRFLVRSAANTARAIGAVHEAGVVVGDINHSGVLVSDKATVALIDADSFQFTWQGQRHECRVGVPEYTPPELQGLSLANMERTELHDRFGLAVAIFQLLFLGRHPFAGAYANGEMPMERAIRENRFAYTTLRSVGMRPPPAAPILRDVPPPIAAAFEAAFDATVATRPTPRQWMQLLSAMERDLRVCRVDPRHHHSSNAPECPWCRMERLLGLDLFPDPGRLGTPGPTFATDPGAASFQLDRAWSLIVAVPRPEPLRADPVLPEPAVTRSPEAVQARRARRTRQAQGVAALLAAVVILGGAPALWFAWLVVGGFGVARLFGDAPENTALNARLANIERQLKTATADWKARGQGKTFDDRLAALTEARAEYSRLPQDEAKRVAAYKAQRRQDRLNKHLESFVIRKQKIPGIGRTRVTQLSSFGIDTARDVRMARVEAVPGFGPKTATALVDWRRSVEARFVYNEREDAADRAMMAGIKSATVKRASELRRQLAAGPTALRSAAQEVERLRSAIDPTLAKLAHQRAQLRADLGR